MFMGHDISVLQWLASMGDLQPIVRAISNHCSSVIPVNLAQRASCMWNSLFSA